MIASSYTFNQLKSIGSNRQNSVIKLSCPIPRNQDNCEMLLPPKPPTIPIERPLSSPPVYKPETVTHLIQDEEVMNEP